MTPQSGIPHNNRVGDLDASATSFIMKELNLSMDEVQAQLTQESGLLGLSGISNDLRDIGEKAAAGNKRAKLTIDVLVHAIRHWVGAFYLELNGCDALVFTGGIGENNPTIREAVCAKLDNLGIEIDPELNNETFADEKMISSKKSKVKVFVIPANEELVIARETCRLLAS
jgi:acetate kinase